MKVRDIMTREVQLAEPHMTLREAAELMKTRDVGFLPVCDGERLVGMVTDRDITVRAVADAKDQWEQRIRDVMSQKVFYCFEDDDVSEAARLMQERQVRRLVVLNRDKRLMGVVSLGDVAVQTRDDRLKGETLEAVSEPTVPR
jgi:CBS domain-containing protein